MKKIAMILAFLMLIPGAAFGLEMMNDSSMDDVTGQAGVSIALDDIQIFMNIDKMAWIDSDGYAAGTDADQQYAPGAVGISNFQLDVLKMNAPDEAVQASFAKGTSHYDLSNNVAASAIDLQYDYGDTTTGDSASLANSDVGTQTLGLNNYTGVKADNVYTPSALTIDATSELPVLSYAKQSVHDLLDDNDASDTTLGAIDSTGDGDVNIGGVVIGIPTLEINIPTMNLTPAFYDVDGETAADNSAAENADYGTIQMDGITMTTLSGWIEIAPH